MISLRPRRIPRRLAGSVGFLAGSVGFLAGFVVDLAGSIGFLAGSVGFLTGSVGFLAGFIVDLAGAIGFLAGSFGFLAGSVPHRLCSPDPCLVDLAGDSGAPALKVSHRRPNPCSIPNPNPQSLLTLALFCLKPLRDRGADEWRWMDP